MKLSELERTKGFLSQALNATSDSYNPIIQEAKMYIRQAISKLDKSIKIETGRKQHSKGQFEQWWGNIQAGAVNLATGKMTREGVQKSLKQLNAMIASEEQKLADLDKASDEDEELLTD